MKLSGLIVKSTIVGALGGLLFGFDTAVISGTTAQLTAQYHLSHGALGFTVASALSGTVLGAMFAGIPGQRYGRRDSLRVMAAFYVVSALGCAFAWNLPSLIVFRVIGGLGIGGSSVLGPMYIAELAPTEWRGRLVGFFQVNIVVGILLAYVSNALLGTLNLGAVEWRWQLGVSAIPAVLFFAALFFIPRSPRWLLTQGRREEALEVLQLTGTANPRREMDNIAASIREEGTGKADTITARKVPPASLRRHQRRHVLAAHGHQRSALLPQRHLYARWCTQRCPATCRPLPWVRPTSSPPCLPCPSSTSSDARNFCSRARSDLSPACLPLAIFSRRGSTSNSSSGC